MTHSVKVLVDLMETFLDGQDRSMAFADRVQGVLIDYFRGSELFEELSESIALYQPGGGDHLLDENELATEFRYVLRSLKEEGELE